ncbi:hypothetical protein L486_03211 [Kwoniella mangroviensis CBS 10435]|uniref:Uncharacterized protein n=1 Tax=Kwoniella mangroviensis CBS 10435 TaxID=1331196 RepID=A0A1B9IT59_9TREE|nr:hypothetical protein L486_03211 [Kwoniella mangroviensis CBS 10435]
MPDYPSNNSAPSVSSYGPSSSPQPPKSFDIYLDDTDYSSCNEAASTISFTDTAPSADPLYPSSFGTPNQDLQIVHPWPQRFNASAASIETFCTSASESRMSDDPDSYVGEKKDISWLESASPNDQSEPAPPPYSASVNQSAFHSQPYYSNEKACSHYMESRNQSSESVASHKSRWSASKQTFYKKAKSIISRFSSAITGRRDSRLDYDKSFDSDSGSPYEFSYSDMKENGRFTGEGKASTGIFSERGPELVW